MGLDCPTPVRWKFSGGARARAQPDPEPRAGPEPEPEPEPNLTRTRARARNPKSCRLVWAMNTLSAPAIWSLLRPVADPNADASNASSDNALILLRCRFAFANKSGLCGPRRAG